MRSNVRWLVLGAAFCGLGIADAGPKMSMEICVCDLSFEPVSPARSRMEYFWDFGVQPTDAQAAAFYQQEQDDREATRQKLFPLLAQLHATHLREWFQWVRDPNELQAQLGQFDLLIQEAKEHGVSYQLTIAGGMPSIGDAGNSIDSATSATGFTPSLAEFQAYVETVVRHFKGKGIRYSLWNEPNTGAASLICGDAATAKRYVELRHYMACLQMVVAGTPLAQATDITPLMAWLAGQSALATEHRSLQDTLHNGAPLDMGAVQSVVSWCDKEQNDLWWKKGGIDDANLEFVHGLWRQGYGWIKNIDPGAEVLIGELASGGALSTIRSVLARGNEPIVADGIAIHPYQDFGSPEVPDGVIDSGQGGSGGIGNAKGIQKTLEELRSRLQTPNGERLPLYFTEFGYHHAVDDDTKAIKTEDERARLLPRAFEYAKEQGAREMTYYQLISSPPEPKRWNTGILDQDLTPEPCFGTLATWADFMQSAHPNFAWKVVSAPAEVAVSAGSRASVHVELENTGDLTWRKLQAKLVAKGALTGEGIPFRSTAPTQTADFTFTIVAPRDAKSGEHEVKVTFDDDGKSEGEVLTLKVKVAGKKLDARTEARRDEATARKDESEARKDKAEEKKDEADERKDEAEATAKKDEATAKKDEAASHRAEAGAEKADASVAKGEAKKKDESAARKDAKAAKKDDAAAK
ncbi:MAG TPA: hypothetical protein VFF73_32610, partial [Planctomycetota bacterium]|nr:hypothetical protein [Planctomycetota bacterium]